MSTKSVGWLTLFGASGEEYSVWVPACAECSRRLVRERRWDKVLTWLVIAIGIVLSLWLLRSYDGLLKEVLAAGIALGTAVPVVLWRLFRPLEFELTAFSESVQFEFRDANYAREFAILNRAGIRR